MKANKKMIQMQLSKETGRVVLLKDLSNIASSSKNGQSRNNVDAVVQLLVDKYGELICTLPLLCIMVS